MHRTLLLSLLILGFSTPAWAKKAAPAPPPPPPPAPASGLDDLWVRQPGESLRASSADATSDPVVAPGETIVLAEISGPAVIERLWIGVEGGDSFWRDLVLRIHWDGQSAPSVEAPIADLFVVGPGARQDVQSLPIVVQNGGRSFTAFWKMPFRSSARITLTNEGIAPTKQLAWEVSHRRVTALPDRSLYFHAQYAQTTPNEAGKPLLVLKTQGAGQFVGLGLSVQNGAPGAWGNGRIRLRVDDRGDEGPGAHPLVQWFGGMFGHTEVSGPVQGCTLDEGERVKARTSVYRFHIDDPVTFDKSLVVEIDHGVQNERPDRMATVAFWYQDQPAGPMAALVAARERRWPAPTDAELALWTKADELNQRVLDAYRRQDLASAQSMLEELQRLEPESVYVHYNLACLYALHGKKDKALHMLDQAIQLGFTELSFARHDPDLASLREEPRYRKLVGLDSPAK